MRNLILLVCVVLTQGRLLMKRDVRFPAPQITKITAVDPPGFQIEWERVKADIVGYRVKVWELPTSHTLHYEVQNGRKVLVDEINPQKFPSSDSIPENKPRVYTVSTQAEPTLIVRDIKLHTIYETRVQAFNSKEDGPLSAPMRIKLG